MGPKAIRSLRVCLNFVFRVQKDAFFALLKGIFAGIAALLRQKLPQVERKRRFLNRKDEF